jgi:hypothetical protein
MKRNCDIAIFGAGPAGIAAAVSAAREGLDVCLVERQNRIGGVMASCPGMMLGGGYPCGKSIGGFFEEFVNRLFSSDPPLAERRTCHLDNFGDEVYYHPEYALAVLEELLDEAGVPVLLNRIPSDVQKKENRIDHVDTAGVQGIERITAGMYLDCTGNGDLSVKAGVPYEQGDSRGKMMGASLTFFLGNVDWSKAFTQSRDPYFTTYAAEGIRDGLIDPSIPQIYMVRGYIPGTVYFNTVTVTGVDGTSDESVYTHTQLARRRALELAEFCKARIPDFGNAFMFGVGPQLGIRETRRMEGMYRLRYQDIAGATKFEDGIVACDNPLDEVFRDEDVATYSHEAALEKGEYYTIPLGILLPKHIENLGFAGRCASVDLKSFASIRGMPQCMAMGQAVACAASHALRDGRRIQDVSPIEVVGSLAARGVVGIGGAVL